MVRRSASSSRNRPVPRVLAHLARRSSEIAADRTSESIPCGVSRTTGYTPRNALEVVLGIGAYTMSTLANRMTGAPLDEQLKPFTSDDPAT
jgi:hypothetical protein